MDAFEQGFEVAPLIVSSTSHTPSPAASTDEPDTRVRRRPIPRKGHTKSRKGCFSCKRRKVKCQETLPECDNCTRIGLVCRYPPRPRFYDESAESDQLSSAQPAASSSLVLASTMMSVLSPPLDASPTKFTRRDMQFFHHFLTASFPPLPLQGAQVWQNVATLSHDYDFLMHSMLGLAASHLDLYGGECSSQAIAHRVKAIQLLNEALSRPCQSSAEGDARYGSILALAFQSSCMPDGMAEFFNMLRGCHVIARISLSNYSLRLFSPFCMEGWPEGVQRWIDTMQRLLGSTVLQLDPQDDEMVDGFQASLRALAPLCTSPLEVRFLAATERTAKLSRQSAADAFCEFANQYYLLSDATNDEFAPFCDPNNYSAQLLLLHFVLMEYSVGRIALGPERQRWAFRQRSSICWTEQLAARLPEEYQKYIEWPLKFVDASVRDMPQRQLLRN